MSQDDQYQEWSRQRTELARLIQAVSEVATVIDDGLAASLDASCEQLLQDSFRIMLIGVFDTGKSTLIDAMLGEKLLPSRITPCTAFTTVLQWAEDRQARLYRLDESGAVNPKPDVVSIEEFQRRVHLEPGPDGQSRPASPYRRATVSVPLPLLKSGVELIDSAGVDEDVDRDNITLESLTRADAIIFVTRAVGGFTDQERSKYLSRIRNLGHADIFVVVNQFDYLHGPEDQESVRNRARGLAAEFTTDPARRVFFTSAKNALNARTGAENAESLGSTGVPELEDAIADFCRCNRRRVKLGTPANQLERGILSLQDRIRGEHDMLNRDVEEVDAIFQAQAPDREKLVLRRRAIIAELQNWVTETLEEVGQAAEDFYRGQASDVAGWVEGLELTQRIKVLTLHPGDSLDKVAGEISEALSRRQRDDFLANFLGGAFKAIAEQREKNLAERLDEALKEHNVSVQMLRDELRSPDVTPESHVVKQASVANRVMAALLGVALPGLPGFVGAQFGAREMLMSAGPVVAAAVAAHFAAAVFPPAAFVLILGGTVGAGEIAKGRIERKVSAKIVETYAEQLRSNAPKLGRKFADEIQRVLETLQTGLDTALRDEERALEQDVERALAEHRGGKAKVLERQQALKNAEEALSGLSRGLSEFNAVLYGIEC
jgi:Dynamin family